MDVRGLIAAAVLYAASLLAGAGILTLVDAWLEGGDVGALWDGVVAALVAAPVLLLAVGAALRRRVAVLVRDKKDDEG